VSIYTIGNHRDNCIAIERFLKATLGDIFLYNRAYYNAKIAFCHS